jgi:hypothetical protein
MYKLLHSDEKAKFLKENKTLLDPTSYLNENPFSALKK